MGRILTAGSLLLLLFCGPDLARLRKQLNHPDPRQRIAAIDRLVSERDTVALPLILGLLRDSVAEVRSAAARGLGVLGDERAAGPLAELYGRESDEKTAKVGQKSLVALGTAAVEPLVRLLRSGRPEVRAGAASALGRIGSANAVDALIRLLSDSEPMVRRSAVFALRQIGERRGLEAVARLAESERGIDEDAAGALGGEGYREQLERARRIVRQFR